MLNTRSPRLIALALFVACAPAVQQPLPPPEKSSLDASADVAPAPTLALGMSIPLPTGATLTPDIAPGSHLYELDPHLPAHPDFRAGFAVSEALSPDGKTLAVLTSGFNVLLTPKGDDIPDAANEYVFMFDVQANGELKQSDVIRVPNTFVGLSFAPTGDRLFVSGGPDDVVHELRRDATTGKFAETSSPIALGHLKPDNHGGLGLDEGPFAAGVGVSSSGALLVVANHENDTVQLIDTATRKVTKEISLRPGNGIAGGEFPLAVLVVGEDRAYVTCQRDRELVEIDLVLGKVSRRVRVGGQPTRVIATKDGKRLFVANANSDTVSVIDRESFLVREEIRVAGPLGSMALSHRGSSPNALRLSPNDKTLYVSLGGADAIAIVSLASETSGVSQTMGLVPTGFYPNDVIVSPDGKSLWVAYGKSSTGPNPHGPRGDRAVNVKPFEVTFGDGTQFALQLVKGGVHAFPVPDARLLEPLTRQALANHHLDVAPTVPPIFKALENKVTHVIFVVGENRTYDQVLGDVQGADGDPSLTMWGKDYTPNLHALTQRFVLLDRFFDSGGVSGDGWQWTMAGRSTDVAEKAIPVEYADRGRHTYDWEGTNRNINVSLATLDERLAFDPKTPKDIDLLPGQSDVGGVDTPIQGGRGYLWDVAIAGGKSIRNYGCFVEDFRYGLPKKDPARVLPIKDPFKTKTRVAFPTSPALHDVTDPYFRGFDMAFADHWRVNEWMREFDGYDKTGTLPSLELVRLPRDHTGAYSKAEDGVDTPDAQVADHDYALGRLVERVSKSQYWESTLIVVLEDDAQNGADHVDSHRSFVAFAGGHAKSGLVHGRYTTPSVLRTIELILGIQPMSQADAVAPPIAEALTEEVDKTPYVALIPNVLRSTKLPLPPSAKGTTAMLPRGDAAFWTSATVGMDFDHADRLPAQAFNRALACGLLSATGCTSRDLDIAQRYDDD
jgi:YVTN family beta-propeller protein